MSPKPKTYRLLAQKVLQHYYTEDWVLWAIDMVATGNDQEYLLILAGQQPPFNYFEMEALTDKVVQELGMTLPDEDTATRHLVHSLVEEAVAGHISHYEALARISAIYVADHNPEWSEFDSLFTAKDDLVRFGYQYYRGLPNDAIDAAILDYFNGWLEQHPLAP